MENYSRKRAKSQKNLDAMELNQVWNNEDARAICCSIVTVATTGATINEISRVR